MKALKELFTEQNVTNQATKFYMGIYKLKRADNFTI